MAQKIQNGSAITLMFILWPSKQYIYSMSSFRVTVLKSTFILKQCYYSLLLVLLFCYLLCLLK